MAFYEKNLLRNTPPLYWLFAAPPNRKRILVGVPVVAEARRHEPEKKEATT